MAEGAGEQGLRPSLIVDVSAIPLADLAASTNSALLQSIQLVVSDVDAAANAISGWTSYLDSDFSSSTGAASQS